MVMKKGPMNKFIGPLLPDETAHMTGVSSSDHLPLAVSVQCCRAGNTEEDPLIHVFLILVLWTSGSRQTATEVRRAAHTVGGNIGGIIRAGADESGRSKEQNGGLLGTMMTWLQARHTSCSRDGSWEPPHRDRGPDPPHRDHL
ncbi:unnamed protein product [Arctogadus glacialis]